MSQDSRVPAVVVDDVSKTFALPHEHVHTLKERALHPFRRSGHDVLRALRGVSFAVEPGEFFGIVGRNGSGKSTLLKCLAGIYRVDDGRIYVDGRMSTFIELGVGFNMDLPARDNVILNATMLGLTQREARERMDRIIGFAELEDFVDLKLKNYSSGMLVRLAFAVMIQVDADILLIDEVLAVGDAAFQQKCYDEFARIRKSGTTVLLVTHDMASVRRFCDRAMLIEHGRVVAYGDPETVGQRYLELNFSEQARAAESENTEAEHAASTTPTADSGEQRVGDRSAEVVEAWFENAEGARIDTLPLGEKVTFANRVRFKREVVDPLFGFELHTTTGDPVMSASSLWEEPNAGTFAAGREVVWRVSFINQLTPDRYMVTAAAATETGWLDRRRGMSSIVVMGVRRTDGVVEPELEMSLEDLGQTTTAEVVG